MGSSPRTQGLSVAVPHTKAETQQGTRSSPVRLWFHHSCDNILQGLRGEGLHHLRRWLGRNLLHLPEDHPFASLTGGLLHLRGGDLAEGIENTLDLLLLQPSRRADSVV